MKNTQVVTSRQRGVHYGFVIVLCCCLMMGINVGLVFSCAGIFYEPVSRSLGVPVGEFGLYMSIMYVSSTLMLPLAGRMLERGNGRLLFTASSALMGGALLLMALADSLWQFYLAGAILGVTLAFLLYLSFPTLVNRWFRKKVGLMIGVCSAASGVGGMLFNPMAGWIMGEWGWRWAYGAFAVIVLLVVTPLLGLLLRDYPEQKGLAPYGADADASANGEKPEAAGAARSGVEYRQAIGMWQFYAAILFAFLMMGISTLNLFIPGYTTQNSFTLEQASMAAAGAMAGVTLGKLILGYVNDRSCKGGTLLTTLLGASGLVVMIFGSGSIWLICAGAFMFGWCYAGVTVQTAMITRSVFGSKSYAAIYSVVSMALAAGGAVASGGWGLLADATSYRTIFLCGATGLIVALAIGMAMLGSARK